MRAHLYVALSSCVVIALITSLAVILYGARNTSQPGTDMGCVQQSSGYGPHMSLRCLAGGVGGSARFVFKSDPTTLRSRTHPSKGGRPLVAHMRPIALVLENLCVAHPAKSYLR